MKIQIKIIKENEDGSANALVDFDKEGLEVLVQWGLIALIKKGSNKYKIDEVAFPISKNKRK